MKVLWFVNTSGNSRITNSNNRGGWISSLETAILENTNIELSLAFPSDILYYKKIERVFYHGLKVKHNTKLKRLFQRYFNKLPNEIPMENILNLIESVHRDIIHIHGTQNSFGLVIDKVKIPIVVSIQGNTTVYSKKYFSGMSRETILSNTNILDFLFRADFLSRYKIFQKQSSSKF